MTWYPRTGVGVTNVLHDFRGALDVDLHAVGFQTFDNDTHPSESRNKVEDPNNT